MTEELIKKIIEALEKAFPDVEGVFNTKFFARLAGTSYTGIFLHTGKTGIASGVVNLDDEYMNYLHGFYESFEDFIDDLGNKVIEASKVTIEYDFSAFEDYNKAKEMLYPALLPLEKVDEDRFVSYTIGDIAIVYRIVVDITPDAHTSTTVTNDILKQYGITKEQLHKDAVKNMSEKKEVELLNLGAMCGEEIDGMNDLVVSFAGNDKSYGAAAILMNGVADQIHDILGDYYILPSSTDEVIVCPICDGREENYLRETVEQVSKNICDPDIYLSCSLYRYNEGAGTIEIVEPRKEN